MKTVMLRLNLKLSKKKLLEETIWIPRLAIKPIIDLPELKLIDAFTYKFDEIIVKQIIYPWDSTKYHIETKEKAIGSIEYSYPCFLHVPYCSLRIKVSKATAKPTFLLKREVQQVVLNLFDKYLAEEDIIWK